MLLHMIDFNQSQLYWKMVPVVEELLREEAKALEHQDRVRGYEASQNQVRGVGHYADLYMQAI